MVASPLVAAITPHLGEEQPLDPIDADYANTQAGDARLLAKRRRGMGRTEAGEPTQGEVVGRLHADLVSLASTRYAIDTALSQRVITVRRTDSGFWLYLDPPFGRYEVGWSPITAEVERVALLSWTSKMGAPSFSLPAGYAEIGGACPGAAAGQSVVSEVAREKQTKVVLRVLAEYDPERPRTPRVRDLDLAACVCEHCYATGGNYVYSDNLVRQAVRMAWTTWALGQPTRSPYGLDGGPSNLFVDTMVEAINTADFQVDSCEPQHWASTGWRYFRIHDSGDFGAGGSYFESWKAITDCFAEGNPHGFQPTMFWAPTRMWAVPGWIERIEQVNGGAKNRGNFVIRPSGYAFNQHVPDLASAAPVQPSGWAAGSTVYAPAVVEAIDAGEIPSSYNWNCQAYAASNGPTCRGAMSPPLAGYEGKQLVGCRACWMEPRLVINYTAH